MTYSYSNLQNKIFLQAFYGEKLIKFKFYLMNGTFAQPIIFKFTLTTHKFLLK